jgi:hypothetical protein
MSTFAGGGWGDDPTNSPGERRGTGDKFQNVGPNNVQPWSKTEYDNNAGSTKVAQSTIGDNGPGSAGLNLHLDQ